MICGVGGAMVSGVRWRRAAGVRYGTSTFNQKNGGLAERGMRWQDHIERNPKVMLGKPVVRGTRITVELILERLGDGWSEEDLLRSYPHLRPEHIRAAQSYAAAALASDEIVFLGEQG